MIRYHLGLSCPPDSAELDAFGRPKCFIQVDAHRHVWQDGKDFLFDDCFLHEVRNNTAQPRVILLVDVPRVFKSPLVNWVNRLVLKLSCFHENSKTFYANVRFFAQDSNANSSKS